MTAQETLERALVDDPSDVTAHAAYADCLTEAGDPRGEFVQVQLALEDPAKSPAQRQQLRAREQELLAQHGQEFLGSLGRFFVGAWSGDDKPYHFRFERGWLDSLRALPFPAAVLSAIARAPEIRLLRRLEVVYDMRYHPFEFEPFIEPVQETLTKEEQQGEAEIYENTIPPALFHSPYLHNLRSFKLGYSDIEDELAHSTMVDPFGGCNAQAILSLVERCPRLDELYLNTAIDGIAQVFSHAALGNLRVLQ